MDIGEQESRSSGDGRSRLRRHEWVGGRVVSPFYVTEGTPYRPELVLWLELPERVVVFFELSKPGAAPASFGATLVKAMESPLIGPPRAPSTVRVSDARLAAEVRRVLPDSRIVEAATPELDEMVELMAEAASQDGPDQEPSYFGHGQVGAPAIEALFLSARLLYRLAPWKVAGDDQILRVDVPALGVEAACLSIIGALGKSLGLILFPSLDGFERFLDAVGAPRPHGAPIDLGTSALSLDFESGSDLPASMYREALKHGWPVAGKRAYPIVRHRDRDGTLRPLTERDVRVMAACAASLAAFFGKHREQFRRDACDEPICESYFDEDDLEVRFTLPYEAGDLFAVNAASHPTASAGHRPAALGGHGSPPRTTIARNAPCPCGSGKKYKFCCLAAEQSASTESGGLPDPRDAATAPAPSHELDWKLVDRMDRYARKRFGPDWMIHPAATFRDRALPEALLGPWSFYHHLLEGKSAAQWFFEDRAGRLPADELSWLNAQRAAWLSVWETLDVECGRSVALRDLLTGETRVVWETKASRTLGKRDAVLARVVDHEGTSVLCGLYPRSLPPGAAAAVVEQARRRLRRRSRIPVERLRGEPIGRYLIACWEDAVEDEDARARRPRKLANTDGDPLLITVDHFRFDPADRAEIQRRLASAEEIEAESEPDDTEPAYVFTKPSRNVPPGWDRTVTGRATLSGAVLRLESNSTQRADSLRELVERLMGPLISHRAREHADPLASLRDGRDPGSVPSKRAPTDEENQVLLEVKGRHYEGWLDQPLPALGGKTPREAVRTKAGRRDVDLLLREMENWESRVPAGQRFDFDSIRRKLRLEETPG